MINEPDSATGVVTPPYIYRALCVSVYDGDTITVDVDLGFGVWMHGQKLRLFGINAPEVRGDEREAGLESRDALRAMLPAGKPIVIATKRDRKGKYGRWLAEVFYMTNTNPEGPMNSVTETLVVRGFAKRASY
jgi:micrococcal nuclease